jgi:pimeloyl-ACP methyl ester carboxylesterase
VLLVVLPGMDGSGKLLDDFVAALGDDFASLVIRYPPDRPMNYAELEVFVLQLLPKRGPYVLLAESFSGPIAISIAASKPPGLAGVILSASFARNPRPVLSLLRPLLAVLPLQHLPVHLLSIFLLGRFATPIHRMALSKAMAELSASTFHARARAVLDVDVMPIMHRVGVPLLYLRANDDRVVPPDCGQSIVETAPQARLIVIDAPHFLLQTAAAPAAAIVKQFVASLPAGTG